VVPTTAPDRLVDLLFRPYRYVATTIGLIQPATIWLTFGKPNAPDANGIALRPGHNYVEVILAADRDRLAHVAAEFERRLAGLIWSPRSLRGVLGVAPRRRLHGRPCP